MRKLIRNILLATIFLVVLIILTGCGGNKLVAKKTTEEVGIKIEEKIEVTFKDNKISQVVAVMEFESEETAKMMVEAFSYEAVEGLEVEQDGNKMTMTMNAQIFADMQGEPVTVDITKEDMKKFFEDEGYKVK